ncbi:MAG: hypothetical protein WC314_07690, partial [Vulcanimicrobiota bacterium]
MDLLRADFPEPFIPTVKGADKEPLASVLERYAADPRPKSKRVDLLEDFLEANPGDPWGPSVRLSLGVYYHQGGRFTRALRQLEHAWEDLKSTEDPRLKPLADQALGEYALTLAHLGRVEDLEPLLESVKGRSLQGSATELVAAAREGLYAMKVHPEDSFWCGPLALKRLLQAQDTWDERALETLKTCPSTSRGTSLVQIRDLSEELGMNYQMAYRGPGSAVITPAVVNWSVGHYAALLDSEEGLYTAVDDTAGFARDRVRIDIDILEEEASGYFLVPPGPLPAGWRAVSREEGRMVWGRGNTGLNSESTGTGSQDHTVGQEKTKKGPPCPAMTGWSAHTMLVSLRLQDTPVGLSPAAFALPFTVTYAHREINQPSVFDYSNLGPKWTTNWTSFLTDQRSSNGKVVLYKASGGSDEYQFLSGSTISQPGSYSQASLLDTGDGFRLDWPDGSYHEYEQFVGGRYFLSALIDSQGNTIRLEYDLLGRLQTIRDAVDRPMSLFYGLPDDPFKITEVTDPFGRSASFAYTSDGHLESVTDTLGIVSNYQYGANDFIHTLSTPYGTTHFSYGDINTDTSLGVRRFLEVTDSEGRTSRLESAPYGSSSESVVPAGMPVGNVYLRFRNSFFWEPQQLDAEPDYSKATVYHFMHQGNRSPWTTGRTLESMKRPLENRVWYAYDQNPNPIYFTGRELVTHIGRVLGDGTTQLTKYSYNAPGHVTQMTDPAGRVFNYTYAPNEIDLTSVSTGGQSLFSATYDDNHNITSLIDASGGTSTFTYNSRGQVTSMTNPLGETTNYTYTFTGNLYTIEAPMGKVTTFLYDSAERVSTVVDSEGYSAQVTYDALDRPLSVTYPDGTTDTLT